MPTFTTPTSRVARHTEQEVSQDVQANDDDDDHPRDAHDRDGDDDDDDRDVSLKTVAPPGDATSTLHHPTDNTRNTT